MPQILSMQYFLKAQGMKVFDNVVHHDTYSEIKLEKNGRSSSGKQTQHVNIGYFMLLIVFRQTRQKLTIVQQK